METFCVCCFGGGEKAKSVSLFHKRKQALNFIYYTGYTPTCALMTLMKAKRSKNPFFVELVCTLPDEPCNFQTVGAKSEFCSAKVALGYRKSPISASIEEM